MTEFFEQLINGLQLGSIYALIALGYTMVYGIAKMINFAHGDIIMVGAYVLFICTSNLGLPVFVAIPITILACALLGVVTEKVAYKPLRKAPRLAVLITAIGVSFLLQNGSLLIFSANPKPYESFIKINSISIAGVNISGTAMVTLGITLVATIAINYFIKKTKAGNAMRAVSEDSDAAGLMGINVNRTISMTFAIGSGLAAIAGILFVCTYPKLYPTLGAVPGIKAFVAAVLGGIGNVPGAILGGLLLGVIESFSKAYVSSQLYDAIVYGVLVVVLLLKPSGLMGKDTIEKV